MVELIVVDRDGAENRFTVKPHVSVMEAIRDSGVDELLALCGGACSCATCHVYLDPAFSGAVPPISEDESDLLDSSSHRTDRSRLSCQLRLDDDLSGLRVTIAPED